MIYIWPFTSVNGFLIEPQLCYGWRTDALANDHLIIQVVFVYIFICWWTFLSVWIIIKANSSSRVILIIHLHAFKLINPKLRKSSSKLFNISEIGIRTIIIFKSDPTKTNKFDEHNLGFYNTTKNDWNDIKNKIFHTLMREFYFHPSYLL